ncbi:hypothetical protein C8Q77DRAFT_1156571 [Trametes polyzona]|nr:hypothetical protein C8Q77DRAFT_1156571 [Trametes polyzona]
MATGSLADLTLYPATPEQLDEVRKRTSVQWGKGLSLEDYIYRDILKSKLDISTNGKLITWVLVPRNDPTTVDFLSSCETYRRAALVAKHAKEGEAQEVREVTAYGVACVFTPASKRGKGYARHMMRLLHWVLAPRSALPAFPAEWGTPPDLAAEPYRSLGVGNALFSVLYSAVGRDFYQGTGVTPGSNDGWVATGLLTTSKAVDATEVDARTSPPDGSNIQRLSFEDVVALYEHDAVWLKDDLHKLAAETDRTLFTFLPNGGVGAVVVQRHLQVSGPPDNRTLTLPHPHWGVAILPTGTPDLPSALQNDRTEHPIPFATWTFDAFPPRTLVVTRLRADERTFPALLDALLAAARDARASRVEFWYLLPALRAQAEARGWATRERDDHFPAVKWYGAERTDEREWVFNEKFSYC